MYKFKVGDLSQYDESGNYIGVQDITEPTYYETLLVVDGYVSCEHLVSREHLLNRGYEEISETQEEGGEEEEKIVFKIRRKNKELVHSD